MASVSQIRASPWLSRGTRKDGDRCRSSARLDGSSIGSTSSSMSSPAMRQQEPASERPGRVVPAADGEPC